MIYYKNIILSLALALLGSAQIKAQINTKDTTFNSDGNPIITHKYTADPAPMVYNNTLYVYTGHDECPVGENRYVMNNWCVFSTTDMKQWTEHPTPLKASDFAWAKGEAWASQVIERNGKFYWYISVEHGTIKGKSVGVAVADNPLGPFRDARGSAIITNDLTTKWVQHNWDDIDPTVIIDDDKQAYMFWGNRQCYYIKLKENMTDTIGPIMAVENLPDFREAPWIHKKGHNFYLSYAIGFPERIGYSMSKNVNGPWEYKGILNELSGNSGTNHQGIVKYKGKWYFFYHNGGVIKTGGSYRRSVCVDQLYYNLNGTMKRVRMTTEGVKRVK